MASLKDATAALHRHAETRAFQKSLLKGTATPACYRAYLIELLAIHSALERELMRWRERMPSLAGVFMDDQRRAADLQDDIVALSALAQLHDPSQQGTATQARSRLVQFIEDCAERSVMPLLGCLYVLEGSMNGNAYIARALTGAWNINDQAGLYYLDPYGPAQRETWQRFRVAMNGLDVTEDDIASATQAACMTFEAIAHISDEVLAHAGG